MSYPTYSRGESIIATGRLILALASFAAIYFDPLEPRRFVTATYALLGLYVAYSFVAFVAIVLVARPLEKRERIASHTIDIVFFGTINYLTAGSSSPFFVYFVFTIVCAMLRFGRGGTLLTAAVAGIVFVSSALATHDEPDFEMNRFVIRLAYLAVVTFLMIALAQFHDRVRRDLSRIAEWRRGEWLDRDHLVASLLEEVASIFAATHVALAYDHVGERVAYVASLRDDGFRTVAQSPDVADAILEKSPDAHALRSLPAALRGPAHDLISVPIEGDFIHGRLVLFEDRPALQEDAMLATIAAKMVAGRLDHHYAAEQMQRGAVAEERVRVARDLHDSVLQSLTGASLQISTLPKVISRDPIEFRERISQIADIIMGAQTELRRFIDNLHPERRERPGAVVRVRLRERLAALAQRFWQQWRLTVVTQVEPVVQVLPVELQGEIYALASEIVANAAKHAQAQRVEITIGVDRNDAVIRGRDDGRGFPFHGRFTLDELVATRRGPVTLKDRVTSLKGDMVIDSSDRGSSIELRIPIAALGETA
ncbi:MAG TPA: histidine kinase [Thermoanaerobaculia bacterium]|nr:histidine kinase [Thermoanaerobaculia bacterium]